MLRSRRPELDSVPVPESKCVSSNPKRAARSDVVLRERFGFTQDAQWRGRGKYPNENLTYHETAGGVRMGGMTRLEIVIDGIKTARGYTERLLERTKPEHWFRQPSEGVTHIAWQVGHLAFAQYAIALRRVRGRRPEDAQLLPEEFNRYRN